jgi:excisionase family DNA binding protein
MTQYLKKREVAERYSLGLSTINKFIADGRLPAYKFGTRGDIRIAVEDIEALFTRVNGGAE